MKNKTSKQPIILWKPLPESQQEMLSGGAPRINGGGSGSGDSGGTGSNAYASTL